MAKKSSSVTFRIDENYDKKLRKLAEQKHVSLNTLANNIFRDYVEQEIYTRTFGTMKMSTDTFRRMLSKISEKDLMDLATRSGSQEAKEFILFKWKSLNLTNVVEFIQLYFDYCGYGRCTIEETEGKITFSAHHDLKEKGSLYLRHFIESLVRTALDRSCESIMTEDSITFSFQT